MVAIGTPPENPDDYDKYEADGINVHVLCDVQPKDEEITVKYVKFLFKGSLVVHGIAV